MTGPRLVLYSRSGCPLCEEMEAALHAWRGRLAFRLECVDIDADPELVRRYNDQVPVLADGQGAVICRHFLDEEALQAHLA
mgnify:CR=1 FL=1